MTYWLNFGCLIEDKSNGVYFIRKNYNNTTETQLWSIYNIIREVESTFRCLKVRFKHQTISTSIR